MKVSPPLLSFVATLLLPSFPSWFVVRPLGEQSERASSEGSDAPKEDDRKPPVKLGMIPPLKLNARQPVLEAESKRIKALIANLRKLDSPDFGLSPTLAGEAFAPIPGQSRAGALLFTNHNLKPSDTLKELVSLGPDALPFLLDALDDKTPTKIVIDHDVGFGAMWYGDELGLNPVNPAETTVYKKRMARKQKSLGEEKSIQKHPVTVGDVCFVAIGQIVGRGYSAVRYQPTACIVINSTTHDANLCADVRAIWTSKDSRQKLFDSLLADYATEWVVKGGSLQHVVSELQCSAALRLIYYFPKESVLLIRDRLDKLDVGRGDFDGRFVANGVRARDFIKAVAWSKEKAIRSSLTSIFKRSDEVEVLEAALPGVDDKMLIRDRLEPLIDKLPPEEGGPYGDGYTLLTALCEATPDTARTVVTRYLRGAGEQRCLTACMVLGRVEVSWDVEVLASLLSDKRESYWNYQVDPKKNESTLRQRICDVAATTLAQNHSEFKFRLAGQHADLDKQISVIKEKLKRKK